MSKKINLHGVAAELKKVKDALSAARLSASPKDHDELDLKIRQVDEIEKSVANACKGRYGMWGEDETPRAHDLGRSQAQRN